MHKLKKLILGVISLSLLIFLIWFAKGYFYGNDLIIFFNKDTSVEQAAETVRSLTKKNPNCRLVDGKDSMGIVVNQWMDCTLKVKTNKIRLHRIIDSLKKSEGVVKAGTDKDFYAKSPESPDLY